MVKLSTKSKDADTIELLRKRVGTYGLRSERVAMEEQWLKNCAFFSGKQHFFMINGQLVDATRDIPEHRIIYKVNLVRTAVQRAVAKVVGSSPTFRAVPPSDSIRSRAIAETSEHLFTHMREATEFESRYKMLGTTWACMTGSGFYKVIWNEMAGDPQRYYFEPGPTGKKQPVDPLRLTPERVQNITQKGDFEDFFDGDVSVGVESPFAMFWDWAARDGGVKDAHWMASRHYVDIERVAEQWNIDVNELQPDADSDGFYNYEEAVAFMTSSNIYPMNFGIPEEKRGKRCQLVDMWERPTRTHKRGRRIVYAGKKVLFDGDNPHAGDRSGKAMIPWVKQDWSQHPGRFIGSSLVEDLTNPQYNLNEASARVLEFLRVFGAPPVFVGSNSGIEELTIDPGAIYTVNENSKGVQFAPTPQLPPAVVQAGAMCQAHLQMIASQDTTEQGSSPGQLRSGSALQALESEKYVTLTTSAKMCSVATLEVGTQLLTQAQLRYKNARILKYLGDDNEWIAKYFTGADITNELRIIGEYGDIDGQQKTKNEIMNAVQIGALQPQTNPEHARLVVRALRLNSSEEIVDTVLLSIRNQEREFTEIIENPERYAQGGYPVADFEDHASEYATCQRFMYRQQFRKLPPQTKAIIAAHAAIHKEKLMQEQAAIAQLAQATKGMPAQVGQASQPSPTQRTPNG